MKAVFGGLLLLASVLLVLGHPPLKSEEKHDSLGDCRSHGDHPGHAAACGPSEHKQTQHQFAHHHPHAEVKETVYTEHFVTNPIGYENNGSSNSTSTNALDTNALKGGNNKSPHSAINAHKHSPGPDYSHNYESNYHTATHSSPHSTPNNHGPHEHEHSGSGCEHNSEHDAAHHNRGAHDSSRGAPYGVGSHYHSDGHSSSHGGGHGFDESHHHAGDGHYHGGSHGQTHGNLDGHRPWDQESTAGHDHGQGPTHHSRHGSLHTPQHYDDDDAQEWQGPEYMGDSELEHIPNPNKKPLVHH